ncbi:acyl-CoA dehydrogenase family protein [Nocardia macrotermitis]|uniref:Acyl-CoA dehydrogenase/oxidase C-terminal domain-containing protein n=1 Tax=Nocardia macrotermitis TaxID=2585198 RepID=A0A7K0DAJ3_9NOCA|nr:acyl-CoA dehydrogenase family protein [Nocardia macrotermitis]MQY22619.1 hypothetical protein [Nocardia macrotermitis]
MTRHIETVSLDLDTLLGDPHDPANRFRAPELLAADERREIVYGAEEMLDGMGFAAELIPVAAGGAFEGFDRLLDRMRPLSRFDVALTVAQVVEPGASAAAVFALGTSEQRRRVAESLSARGRFTTAFGDGSDPAYGNGIRVRSGSGVLDGTVTLVIDADRAREVLVFAEDAAGGVSAHLVDGYRHPGSVVPVCHRTLGLHGCRVGELRFDHCAVGTDDALTPGPDALRIARRVRRLLSVAAALGPVDAALFEVLGFAADRHLYGGRVLDLPHARATLAQAYADLQLAELISRGTAHLLDTAPEIGGTHAAAAAVVVPRLLEDAVRELSVVLGARFYLRTGRYALFGKHFRDLLALSICRGSESSCAADVPEDISTVRVPDGLARYIGRAAYADLSRADPGEPRTTALGRYVIRALPVEVADRYLTTLPAWWPLARHRLLNRSGAPAPREAIEAAFADLLDRARECRAFDLAARSLPRQPVD